MLPIHSKNQQKHLFIHKYSYETVNHTMKWILLVS